MTPRSAFAQFRTEFRICAILFFFRRIIAFDMGWV